MNNKYPLLIVDELKKNGLIYPKKVIEDGIENYKKRLKKSGERISGEITSRENHFTVDTEVIPNEKGEVLYWDDFAIEGNTLYGILSNETQKLLDENYPEDDRKFTIRMATKAKRDHDYNGTGESVAIAVGVVIFAVDRVDKRPNKSIN